MCLGEKTHTFGVLGDLLGDPGCKGAACPTGHTYKVPHGSVAGPQSPRNLSGPHRADSAIAGGASEGASQSSRVSSS